MRNQIIQTYALDPTWLDLPPRRDFAEILVHVLIDRADISWRNGQLMIGFGFDGQDQSMIGHPGPLPGKYVWPPRIVHVDRDDNIIDPPDEPELMAEINAWVDRETRTWFEGSLFRDVHCVMPGSVICKMPYTVDVGEAFLYYALLRMMRQGVEGGGKLIYEEGCGYDPESLEQHLLYGLVRRIREEDADVEALGAEAHAVIAEARELITVDGDGSIPLDEALRDVVRSIRAANGSRG